METKDILKKIRTDHQITQDEMAEKLAVTRQAVSRWEQGESIPNIETSKMVEICFSVSSLSMLWYAHGRRYCDQPGKRS